jgi:hypothetical protein
LAKAALYGSMELKYSGLNKRARSQKLREELNSLKTVTPCKDCRAMGWHGVWPSVAMQLDHMPGFEKVAMIGDFVNAGDEHGFRNELMKCEIVCANHHAIRTKRRGVSLVTCLKLREKALERNREIQNRPEVRAKKSAAMKEAAAKAKAQGKSWGRPKKVHSDIASASE